jgi:hypothetical protein
MRAIAFAILYIGLLLATLALPPKSPWRETIGGLCGMAFFLAVLFAILGL